MPYAHGCAVESNDFVSRRILRCWHWPAGCTAGEYVATASRSAPTIARRQRQWSPIGWIDDAELRHVSRPADAAWWQTFNDPVLDSLVSTAYRQNLTLRIAGLRILEARAQRGIVAGELFPQSQQAFGGYMRDAMSRTSPTRRLLRTSSTSGQRAPAWPGNWISGAGFAGQSRRPTPTGCLGRNYDDALVLLLSEVAQRYVDLRTAEQRLEYAPRTSCIQTEALYLADLTDNNRGKGRGST